LLLAQGEPIRIGLMFSLSGPYVPASEPNMKGAQLAIAAYNRRGGLLGRKIEGVPRDDKFSGAGAVAATRDLAGMGINLFVGGSSSTAALATMPLLKELKAVFTIAGAAAMSITHESFTRNAFRVQANANMQYGGLGRAMAIQFPNILKWQVVAPDSAFGRDAARTFAANMRLAHPKGASKELEIRDPMLVGASQSDFRPQINQLMNSGVEGVFFAAVGAPTVSFFQQARSVGLEKKLKAICEGQGDVTAKALGRDMFTYWGPTFWPYQIEPTKSNKLSQEFYKDWVDAYKDSSPPTVGCIGYRAATAILEGVKRAKSTDAEAVIAAMEGLQFDSPTGPVRLRKEDHQSIGTVFFAQYAPSSTEPFYEIKSVKAIDENTVVERPTPGSEYVI